MCKAENINWAERVELAMGGDASVARSLYRHAATYLHKFGICGKLARNLVSLHIASAVTNSIYLNSDSRARAICAAIKLNTATGRRLPIIDCNLAAERAIPYDLVHFVTERLIYAYQVSNQEADSKKRARAVTSALLLNQPIGAPEAKNRRITKGPEAIKIQGVDGTIFPGGEFNEMLLLDTRTHITPAILTARVEAEIEIMMIAAYDKARYTEGQSDSDACEAANLAFNIHQACKFAAEKLHMSTESVETAYHTNKPLHSPWLYRPKKRRN